MVGSQPKDEENIFCEDRERSYKQMAITVPYAMPLIYGKNAGLDTIVGVSDVHFYQSHFGGSVKKANINLTGYKYITVTEHLRKPYRIVPNWFVLHN